MSEESGEDHACYAATDESAHLDQEVSAPALPSLDAGVYAGKTRRRPSNLEATQPHHHGKKAPMREVHKKSKPQKAQKRRGTMGPPKSKAKTKSAAAVNSSSSSSPRSIPVADPFPNRIINPLLELPPTAVTTHDLNQLVSLIFAPPDTYSIAYLARLLGWQLPTMARSSQHTPWTLAVHYNAPLLNNPGEYSGMPREGTFYQAHKGEDWLDKVDPMYDTLLRQEGTIELTPVTATQHLKLVERLDILMSVVGLAYEFGILKDEWTLLSLRDYRLRLEQEQQRILNGESTVFGAQDANRILVPATLSGLVLEHGDCVLEAHYEFQWYPLKSDYEMILRVSDLRMKGESLLSGEPIDSDSSTSLLVLMALILEQARACSVWYVLCYVPKSLQAYMENYFGMAARKDQPSDEWACLVCDIHMSSSRLVFLRYLEEAEEIQCATLTATTHRWIARLPSMDDVGAANPSTSLSLARRHAAPVPRKASQFFTSAPASLRQASVCLRAVVPSAVGESMQLLRYDPHNQIERDQIDFQVDTATGDLPIDFLRDFDLSEPKHPEDPSEEPQLYRELMQKQSVLASLERGLDPRIRAIMGEVIRERTDYEEMKVSQRLLDEQKLFDEYRLTLDRRKELEKAWQDQLEQDMEAVCDVCNDGEVTPDNQILFCECKKKTEHLYPPSQTYLTFFSFSIAC